jgi:hypothetical protein
LNAVREELEHIREAQLRREAEVSQLTESTVRNLSLIESLVTDAPGIRERSGRPAMLTATCGHASCGGPTSARHADLPAADARPTLISLQDLISEAKSNLDRISALVQRPGTLNGDSDGANRPSPPPD